MNLAFVLAIFLIVAGWCSESVAEQPKPESSSPVPTQNPPPVPSLNDQLRAAGITGEGMHRIEVVPTRVFRPRTLTEDPLKAKRDVGSEIERLRDSALGGRVSTRAPSDALKGFLKENQTKEALPMPGPPNPSAGRMGGAKSGDAGREVKAQKGERFALYALRNRNGGKNGGATSSMVLFDQDPDFNFAAFRGTGVPFHVFDVDPAETILVELSGDEVARVMKQNKDWAWIQLDSGLMGLVRNHHVQAAGEFEILKYLAQEYGKKRQEGTVSSDSGAQVHVNLINGSYQVTEAKPARGAMPDEEGAGEEFEFLKQLVLERKAKDKGLHPEGSARVRVNLVNGTYQVTEMTGKDAPAPQLGKAARDKAQTPVRLPERK